jgi:hypothetical protein
MEHFREYYNMTKEHDWTISNYLKDLSGEDIKKLNEIKNSQIEENIRYKLDEKMFSEACVHLQRLYRILANRYAKNTEQKLEYLKMAHEVCQSSKQKC